MKIQVSEASEVILDYLVAKAKGLDVIIDTVNDQTSRFKAMLPHDEVEYPDDILNAIISNMKPILRIRGSYGIHLETVPKYSTDWAQGGPIIGRKNISFDNFEGQPCAAFMGDHAKYAHRQFAPEGLVLIAAMRCYAVSELGEEVEVPEELFK